MKFSKNGYKENSKDKDNPYNAIKGGKITMKGVKHPVMAIPYDKGGNAMPARIMQPEEEYDFGGEVSYVMEIPYKKGGKSYQMGGDFFTQNSPAYQQMSQTVQLTPEQIIAQYQNNPAQNNQQFLNQLNMDVQNMEQENQLLDAQKNLTFANTLQQGDTSFARNKGMFQQQMAVPTDPAPTMDESFILPSAPDKTQFFNPYGGYDIPTAAFLLGENIQQGNTLGTVGSAAKLALGLGRNIVSGLGNAKRNQFVLNEANQNIRDSLTRTQYAQKGGELTEQDLLNINRDTNVQFNLEAANRLFEKVQPDNTSLTEFIPNLGRYREVGYFDYADLQGDTIVLNTTKINPHNKQTINDLIPYLREQNPGKDIKINYIPKMQQGGQQLTPQEAEMLSNNLVEGLQFTGDWVQENIERIHPVQPGETPVVNLGRYKNVNYFDIEQTPQGVVLKTTQSNPHNEDTVKQLLPYLKEMNPNTNLDIQYVPKYKEGGETEELATGDYVTGMKGSEETANIEVEEGEWMLFNNGDVAKVMGDKHKDGGEKMNVAEGTKIISAYTKVGGDTAKEIREQYDIKLTAKDTYAKALDKINDKIGLKKLTEEQEELIQEMEKQKDTKDKSTYDLNMQLITSRLNEIEEEKKPLEEQRREAFNTIFDKQEANKPKEKMQKGGMVSQEITALAEKYNMTPEKVQEILDQYQQGGAVQDKFDKLLSEIGIKSEYTGEDARKIMEALGSTYDLTDLFNVEQLDGKGDNYRLTPKTREQIAKVEQTIQPQGPVNTTITTAQPYRIAQPQEPETIATAASSTQPNGRNVLQMPEQTILPPSPLQPQLLGEVRLGRIEPVYVSPEAALTEQNRQLQTAQEQLNRMPDSQRQAVLASLLATSQNASNQVISQAANQQAQLQADEFNIGQQGREDILNLENALSYEAKVQRGMSNYEQSVNNYFNALTQNQLGKYNEINRLNLLNQLYDNFQYTGDGIEQISQPTFSTPPFIAKNGGKISKKIQDYLKK